MVTSSSSESSDESHQEKLRKKRKKKYDTSPSDERRTSRKDTFDKAKIRRDSRDRDVHKTNKDSRRESNDNHRNRSQRDRDNRDSRDNRENRRDSRRGDDRQNGRRKFEKTSPKRDSRYRHRDYEEKNKKGRDSCEHYKRRDEYPKQKRSAFEEARVQKEPEPEWGKPSVKNESKPKPQEKEKPNFKLSGKLTEDVNTVNGVVINYSEPQDARKPKRRWRLYPFKGEKALPTLYVHRQSAYLMGRDRKIADIPLDHPSCSKQHAVLQYRLVSYQREGGGEGRRIRPYLIDLESANGTFVNNVKLEPRRYHELLERDVIRFGFSTREYVLLHEQSKDDALDDDVPLTTTA